MEPSKKQETDPEKAKTIEQILSQKTKKQTFLEDEQEITKIKDASILSAQQSNQLKKRPNRKKKPQRWSKTDTDTFYKCLEYFGMDFFMIRGVLTHKTKRQLLRKFHKEKKQNKQKVDIALQKHESNLNQKDAQCQSFLSQLFMHTSGSDDNTEKSSEDSLEEVINKKLKLMMQDKPNNKEDKEDKIMSLKECFQKFDLENCQ